MISIYLKNRILKNILLRYLIPTIFPVILAGCHEDFTPDISTKPVLCLNSLITAGQPINVKVTRTWLYSDSNSSDNHSVEDAIITIVVNGEAKDADYVPKEGDHIHIAADSKTYGHAEADVTVPYAVPIKSLRYTPFVTDIWHYIDQYGALNANCDFNINIELDIADAPGTDNYYKFSEAPFNNTDPKSQPNEDNEDDDGFSHVKVVGTSHFFTGTFDYDAEPIFSEHLGVFDSMMTGGAYGFNYFTDRQFSGSTYTLHLHYSACSYNLVMPSWNPDLIDFGYTFTLSSISKSYYNWFNYKWQIDEGVIGDLADLGLGDPVWGYSNVSTGAGVVAAQTFITYTLNLKDFFVSLIQQ